MRPVPLAPSPTTTATHATRRPPRPPPATETFQLYRGGELLATLVDGYTDVNPGWAHHRHHDGDETPRIRIPPRWGDAQWFATDCERVWNGVEVRRM